VENKKLIYIDKDNEEGDDALFWSDYLVDDDSKVAPQVLTVNKDSDDEPDNPN